VLRVRPRVHSPWRPAGRFTRYALAIHILCLTLSFHVSLDSVPGRITFESKVGPFRPSLLAVFLTTPQSRRVPLLLNYLKSAPLSPDLDFQYWIVNYTNENDTTNHFLYPPDEFRQIFDLSIRPRRLRKDIDLASKFFFSLRFFLENSTASWFYRACDDTIINFVNLFPFIQSLDRRWQPRTQPVVLGSCIDAARWSYLQGGSGFLLSRFAADQLIDERDAFIAGMDRPEDVYFNTLLDATGVSLRSATCEFFMGHDVNTKHRRIITERNFDLLPSCPKKRSIGKKQCRPFVVPLNDLVFWHQQYKNASFRQAIAWAKMIVALPRNVHWWSKRGKPHLCWSQNKHAQALLTASCCVYAEYSICCQNY
jgi:hypothetical protein